MDNELEFSKPLLTFISDLKRKYSAMGFSHDDALNKIFKNLFSFPISESEDKFQAILKEIKKLRKMNVSPNFCDISDFFRYRLEKNSFLERCSSSNDSLSRSSNEESIDMANLRVNPFVICEENINRKVLIEKSEKIEKIERVEKIEKQQTQKKYESNEKKNIKAKNPTIFKKKRKGESLIEPVIQKKMKLNEMKSLKRPKDDENGLFKESKVLKVEEN
jgi:hypothetical protein